MKETHWFSVSFNLGISGKTGIRTLGARKSTTVFETAPIDHSGIFPWGNKICGPHLGGGEGDANREGGCGKWALRDSNPRPSACKADALNQLS